MQESNNYWKDSVYAEQFKNSQCCPKLLILDVDGTLTDGRIFTTATGELCKAFNVKDGYGIKHLLPQASIQAAIITGRTSEIVAYRARELGVSACPADAVPAVKQRCSYICQAAGGHGAVREFIEYLIQNQG